MGAAMFYHLTRSTARELVVTLIGKSLQAGWRVELRGTDAARLGELDQALWLDDGFLPHGLAGGPHDDRQPVLLTMQGQGAAANAARCLIALDGADVTAAECLGLDRTCIIFDGNDPAALDRARAQWRALKSDGAEQQYWAEDEGGWTKKQ